jgi:hypothetical protein
MVHIIDSSHQVFLRRVIDLGRQGSYLESFLFKLLGTFGVRRSSKTGFNSISIVQCVNRYPRTKVGIAVDRNNTKLDTEPKVLSRKASA